jgi:YVTN family beta-propeller protein
VTLHVQEAWGTAKTLERKWKTLVPRQAKFEVSRFRRLGFTASALALAFSSLTAVVGMQVATSNRADAIPTAPSVGVGQAPRAVAVDPSTNMIYVANYDDNNVSVIDGATNAVIGSPIHVGIAPYSIAVDSTTHKIYVSNSGDNSISVINGAASPPAVVATIASTGGMGVAVNSVTHTIFGVNPTGYRYNGTVSIIDGSNNRVVGLVGVGANPFPIAVNAATNMVYVANSYDSTVSVIDDSANPPAVVATIHVGSTPFGIAVNSATNTIYSAGYYGQDTTVIDGASNSVTATIGGAQFPAGIAIDEATNTVYAMSQNSGQIQVINGQDNTVSSTVSACNTGWCLGGIAFNSTNHTVYATNIAGNSVSVLSASAAPTISNLPSSGNIGESFTPYLQQSGSNLVQHNPSGSTTVSSSTPQTCALNGDGSVSYLAAGTCTLVSHVSSTQTSIGSGFNNPIGTTVDRSGNVYVADSGNTQVEKLSPNGSGGYNQSVIGSGYSYPCGIAVDSTGTVYVATGDAVMKFSPNGSGGYTESTFASGFYTCGVAVDSTGNVYVANRGNGQVKKFSPRAGGYDERTIGQGFVNQQGLAVDRAGTVFVSDYNQQRIVTLSPDGSGGYNQSSIGPHVTVYGLSVDSAGNIYVPDYYGGQVVEVTPGDVQTTIATGLPATAGVGVDTSGNLFVAQSYPYNQLVEVTPAMNGQQQSFTINKLSLNPTVSLNTPPSTYYGTEHTAVFTGLVSGVGNHGYPLGSVAVYSGTTLLCQATLLRYNAKASNFRCPPSSPTLLSTGTYGNIHATYHPAALSTSDSNYQYRGVSSANGVLKVNSVVVTFSKNASLATGLMSSETFTYGVPQSVTANGFIYAGHSFRGWAVSSNGPIRYTNQQSIWLTSPTTLYAVWGSGPT